MKKTIIAGTASAVFALTPVFGVFATGTQAADPASVADTLKVTVDDTCSLTRSGGSASLTHTMTASQLKTDFGYSEIKSVCNNASGYKVTGTFNALADGTKTIPYQTTAPAAGTSGWTAVLGSSSSTSYITSGTAGNIHITNTADTSAGHTATVSYIVATASDIAAGTYVGTASYVLAQNS